MSAANKETDEAKYLEMLYFKILKACHKSEVTMIITLDEGDVYFTLTRYFQVSCSSTIICKIL